MFDRPRGPKAAVTNVTNRLVFRLVHRIVQGVIQNSRRPVIVLGRAYDEAVELGDLLSPTLSERMRKDASGKDGRRRLGEKWQRPIAQIERFQLEVRASGSSSLDPGWSAKRLGRVLPTMSAILLTSPTSMTEMHLRLPRSLALPPFDASET